MSEVGRCSECLKTFDDCMCSEYEEAQKVRDHELTMRQEMTIKGKEVTENLLEKIKKIILIGILTTGVVKIVLAIANAVAKVASM